MTTEIDGMVALPRPAASKTRTVAIANRNEIAAAGIEALLQARGHSVVVRCSHEDDVLRVVASHPPDIVMLAENIVRQQPLKVVLRLRASNDSLAIVYLLEQHDAVTASDLQDLGVEGILLSEACAARVIDCVESVLHGRKWVDPDLLRHLAMADRPSQKVSSLTLREVQVADLVSRGLRNKQIARELRVCESTVKMHLHNIYRKLRFAGRMQLALSTIRACVQTPESGNGGRHVNEQLRIRLMQQCALPVAPRGPAQGIRMADGGLLPAKSPQIHN